MKKLTYLLSALLIASIGLVGCDNAEDNEAPTLTDLKVGTTSATDGSVTVLAGATTISFTVSDDNEVSSVTVSESGVATPVYTNDKVAKSSAKISFDYTVSKAVSLVITVKDDDDKSISSTLSIKIDAGITSYTAKLLGAQDNATDGSFLATSTGSVYLLADAKTNSGVVDLVYFYGATNFATLAAPSNADAQTVFSQITSWTTKNATSLKLAASTTDFAGINTASGAEAAYNAATGAVGTKANSLKANDIVAFKTAAGKYGLAKVVSIATGATGSITIDVKVGK